VTPVGVTNIVNQSKMLLLIFSDSYSIFTIFLTLVQQVGLSVVMETCCKYPSTYLKKATAVLVAVRHTLIIDKKCCFADYLCGI
jgi:hypothetical protein